MEYVKISLLLACISVMGAYGNESIENIKKEYGVIFDKLFAQGREILETKKDIVEWLYRKNKEEFKEIQNLMTDLRVEVSFDRSDEDIIKEVLKEHLQEKIRGEAEELFVMDGVTVENVQDFFHISRMVCDVILESDDVCREMIKAYKKEYRSAIKELKIVDKAREKIRTIGKERKKQELLDLLREKIVLGTYPRK